MKIKLKKEKTRALEAEQPFSTSSHVTVPPPDRGVKNSAKVSLKVYFIPY